MTVVRCTLNWWARSFTVSPERHAVASSSISAGWSRRGYCRGLAGAESAVRAVRARGLNSVLGAPEAPYRCPRAPVSTDVRAVVQLL